MFYWLLVIILAYLFFGLASLCDKLVLAGKPKPNSYTFYVGIFGLVAILLIPFINFSLPSAPALGWILLNAVARILGIYSIYAALKKFDVSKVIATVGATQPIFIFILTWIFWGPQSMTITGFLAFVLLFLGSVIISIEKNQKITDGYLKITLFSSLMFSLDYIFAKFVFLHQPFLQGIIWVMIFIFLLSLTLLFKKGSRTEIFSKQMILDRKTQVVFLGAQVFGGIGNFLQSFAIFLAPVAFLAVINSLRGVQYVILFIITLFISYFYPKVLKEGLSKKVIFQKTISLILIIAGLMILTI